ncbi:hypothetical protein ADK41_20295 [Streptomyces caelestis]|uniref:Uncharacterized protein n=1 Tax=Streptomyces caelestis TaxID=36816 RepID=A0A0M9X857_9ACTN|nr:hypothetical protein ADK41_20295 [Streptomyces caelestis]
MEPFASAFGAGPRGEKHICRRITFHSAVDVPPVERPALLGVPGEGARRAVRFGTGNVRGGAVGPAGGGAAGRARPRPGRVRGDPGHGTRSLHAKQTKCAKGTGRAGRSPGRRYTDPARSGEKRRRYGRRRWNGGAVGQAVAAPVPAPARSRTGRW